MQIQKSILERLGGHLERLGGHFERLRGILGRLGGVLGRLGGVMGRLGGVLGRLGGVLGASWERFNMDLNITQLLHPRLSFFYIGKQTIFSLFLKTFLDK